MLPLLSANIKILIRNRQALFWALVFPIIFVTVFGLFDWDSPNRAKIAVIDQSNTPLSRQLIDNIKSIDFLRIQEKVTQEADARKKLKDGDISFVLIIPANLQQLPSSSSPVSIGLLYNETNVQQNQLVIGVLNQFIDEVNIRLMGSTRPLTLNNQGLNYHHVNYFDFLVPGLVGMGVMTFSITFIATSIAQYREQKILKRMLATPLRVRKFFLAQIIAHLLLSLVQTAIILVIGVAVFGAHVYGNYLWLVILVMLANIAFLNIGFISAGLTRSVNAANGLANVIGLPMMFLSGTFFPTDSLPSVVRVAVQYLPLTPLLDGLRKVALDAQPIWASGTDLAILGIWVVATSVLAVRVFKFS